MNKKLIAAAAATLLATAAQAQSNFKGWSIGVNANFLTASSELSGGGATLKLGESSQTIGLQGAYSFQLGNSGVLSIGATYNSDAKAGSASMSGSSYELKVKDMYSVYVEPGYAVSNNALLYAKLSMLSAKGEERLNSFSGSETFSGTGFGAGFRHLLNKNLFVQVEFQQMNFDSKTVGTASYKPSATMAAIGLGYKF